LSELNCRYNYMTVEGDVTGFTGSWGTGDYHFTPQHTPGFKAVTNIVGVPYAATVGLPLTLAGTVIPSDADNKTIVWSVFNAENTGANITGGVFTATAAGQANVLATIVNGISDGRSYSRIFTIWVTAKPTITTDSLPNGKVGTAYNQPLASAGVRPITWALDGGSLPGGLSLSSAGVISGTPTAAGTFNFTVKATNTEGDGVRPFTVTVRASGASIRLPEEKPNLPAGYDTDDVKPAAAKTKDSVQDVAPLIPGMGVSDFEVVDGAVTVRKAVAQEAAKYAADDAKLNAEVDEVVRLPVIVAELEGNGKVAAVCFEITGSLLKAESVSDINLVKIFPPSSSKKGEMFGYAGKPEEYGDKKFTLLTMNDATHTGAIQPDVDYKLVIFIRDGGDFDLDGKPNGIVVDPTALFSTKAGKRSSGGSGCDVGTAWGLLLLGIGLGLGGMRKRR
jgi:hypothetical protein